MKDKLLKILEDEMKKFEVSVREAVQKEIEDLTEGDIFEEVAVGSIWSALDDIELEDADGNLIEIPAGAFLVISADETDGLFAVDVYDEDSNLLNGEALLNASDLDELADNELIEEISEDDMELDEAYISFKGGKMKKFKLKAKKGFKRVKGKYVKISAKTLAKMKKNAKKLSKKAKTASAKLKRKKTMKLRKRRVKDSAKMGYEVKEGFDILDGKEDDVRVIALESGDILNIEDGKVTVIREGKNLIQGINIDEKFVAECINESLIQEQEEVETPDVEETEEVETPDVEETEEVPADEEEAKEEETEEVPADEEEAKEEEAVAESVLSFSNDKGYVLTKEGSKMVLGNRVRARSYLLKEGYEVDSKLLDSAFNGNKVSL